jgi:hypothetical protein
MKKTSFVILCLAAAFLHAPAGLMAQPSPTYKPRSLAVPAEADPEKVKDAGNAAIQKLISGMLSGVDLPKKFAILPLQSDIEGGYFTMQLQNTFSRQGAPRGYQLYARDDAQWSALLQEIEWGDSFGDTMDPGTVQKFGRIQGVQALVVGRVTGISLDADGNPQVRVGLQAFEVETGRQIWGGEERGSISTEPKTGVEAIPGGWLTVGGGIVALLILLGILRAVGRAARPR